MKDMIRRKHATQATLDAWRGTRFDWVSRPDNRRTCAHTLEDHLRNMGHEPPAVPEFDSIRGAIKALNSLGWANLTEMLDDLLERRPSPSFMLMGDVALAPTGTPIEGILICAGPMKVFGWHETDDRLIVMDIDLDQLIGAWVA